jgi:hypothetical protein
MSDGSVIMVQGVPRRPFGMNKGIVTSVLLHAMLFALLAVLRVPPAHQPPTQFMVEFKYFPPEKAKPPVAQPPKKIAQAPKPAPKPHAQPKPVTQVKPRVAAHAQPRAPAPKPVARPKLSTSPKPRQPAVSHPHPVQQAPLDLAQILNHVRVTPTPKNPADDLELHQPNVPMALNDHPDALKAPETRDPTIKDVGMRLDRNVRAPLNRVRPAFGVGMESVPYHLQNRQNGAGNSQNHADAGVQTAMLDIHRGMSEDSFRPIFNSAGGGNTLAPGGGSAAPGSGGIPGFHGVADRMGESASSVNPGGWPGFGGPTGPRHAGPSGILSSPTGTWYKPMAGGGGGAPGAGNGGRGHGGGIGGVPGVLAMRGGGGGGPGEGTSILQGPRGRRDS